MKRFYKTLMISVWLPVLLFACIGHKTVLAVQQENATWSFDFKNCSFSDALAQISQATGIEILTNGQIDKGYLSGSFKDQTIDKIVGDLFRRKSHAIMWRYGDKGLVAIDIWVFEKGVDQIGFDPKIFTKYQAPNAKINLTKKNEETAVDRTQSKIENSQKRYASFDTTTKKVAQQTEKAESTQDNKFFGGRDGRLSGNLEENTSNQDDSQRTISTPHVRNKLGNKGSVVPDTAANDVGPDDTHPGPPAPPLEKSHGLEPPPMPPGFSNN